MLQCKTKTIRVFFFVLCSFIFGCQRKEDDGSIFQEIDEGFNQSNAMLRIQTSNVAEVLKQKLSDPTTFEKAEIIFVKVQAIQKESANLLVYLQNLKSTFEKASVSPKVFFIEQNKAVELQKKLFGYRDTLKAIDKRIEAQIIDYLTFVSKSIDTSKHMEDKFKQLFQNTSASTASNFLSRLENNIYIVENQLVNFCNEQVAWHRPIYDWYQVIASQNAKVLRTGDILEITTGLGNFSATKIPTITINGKRQQLNERGIAVYKHSTPNKTGIYSLPVHFTYIDQDGVQQERTFMVEYEVVEAIKKSSASNN